MRIHWRGWIVGMVACASPFWLGDSVGAETLFAPQDAASGVVEVLVEDDFVRGRSRRHHFLVDERGGRTRLHPSASHRALRTGQRVVVRGRAQDDGFHVEDVELDTSVPGQTASIPSSGIALPTLAPADELRPAVVLMVDLRNARASDRYTLDQLADAMFTGARSVDGLFREASFFQTSLFGDGNGDGWADVFGPFAIDYDASCYGYNDWTAATDAAATTAGIDLSLYRHRVYVVPHYRDLGCTWAGLATLGCPGSGCRAWIANAGVPTLFAHELAHNLTMSHASTDFDNDGVVDSEYGDLSDPVGSSGTWRHFNAPHMIQAGWFDAHPEAIATLATGGVYALAPLNDEVLAGPATRVLKLARPDLGNDYYLSFRQPTGYGADLLPYYTDGVSLHHYAPGTRTHLVDVLEDGVAFVDSANRIQLTQLGVAADGSSARVEVALDCGDASPTIEITPAERFVAEGGEAEFTVSVASRDFPDCPVAIHALAVSYPPGLAGTLSPSEVALGPGETATLSLRASAAVDPGPEPIEILDVRHPEGIPGAGALRIDGTPPSTPVLSARVKRKTRVLLSWSPSTDGSGSGISHYLLMRQDQTGGVATFTVAGTGYRDTSTASGNTYQYAVSAVDLAGNASTASAPVTIDLGGGSGGDDGSGDSGGGGNSRGGRGRGRNK